MGIIAIYPKCKKKRSAKIYRLARNRGKTMETPGYNDMPVCIGNKDDVYMEEDNSTQHEKDSVVLTGVMQKQDQVKKSKSAFPVLRPTLPITTEV